MSDRDKILTDLSAYLDGELSPAQVQRVEEAAQSDPAVARELAALRRTRDLVRGLERARPGEDFVAGVLERAERLRLVSSDPERAAGGFPFFRWAAAAAVLLVAAGVGLTVAFMLYSAPPAGTGPGSTLATAPPAAGPSKVYKDKESLSGGLLRPLAFEKDGVEGSAGNNLILYAKGDEYEAAERGVDGVLAANGLQPAGSAREERDGRKQTTILVYADPEQARELRAGLDQLRRRSEAEESGSGMTAKAATADRVPGPAAPGSSEAPAIARAGETPTPPAPAVRGGPPRAAREEKDTFGARDSGQVIQGLSGNEHLKASRPAGEAGRAPATQPANLAYHNQARWNAQPLLITLRSEPLAADRASAAGTGGAAAAGVTAALRPESTGGTPATRAASSAATVPATSPATAPSAGNAK